ncbi:hypothetical protein HPB50_028386 [Hyalomma asiaticum]|nr:hypothetical protein HPB50_028386 [Hyalomma asiaticum]
MRNVQMRSGSKSSSQTSARSLHPAMSKPVFGRHDNTRYHAKFLQRVSKSGRSTVSVWGMITKDGLGPLVRIDGKFTANKYSKILTTVAHRELAKVHLPGAGPVFQHDRSPVHTSKLKPYHASSTSPF